MRKSILITTMALLIAFNTFAQGAMSVKGTVTDEADGSPLPGVSIQEKGTTKGTVTDINGQFSVSVGSLGSYLIFSYVGYKGQEIQVGAQSVIDVKLSADITSLKEVVVTAFGIEKDVKSLGYATTEVEGAELTKAKDVGFASQLSGKVAGLNITKGPTGAAGSTNLTIRGIGNLSGDNRPLIVIDGVPVNNDVLGQAGKYGGLDKGDGLTSINQDDIESINVLKGSAASTLYGERGANGVLVITTKKGAHNQAMKVEYNGNFTMENVALYPDFYQQVYGQGVGGKVPSNAKEAQEQPDSWGEKMQGQPMVYFDGVERPYSPAGTKDILNYYEKGYTSMNSLSMSGGTESVSARMSVSQLENKGIVPNSGYKRYTVNLITSANLSKKFLLEMKANYSQEDARNRINLSDNPSNPGKVFNLLPANISLDMLKRTRDDDGNTLIWSNNAYVLNPYWGPFEHVQRDSRNRLLGYIRGKYSFTEWLSLQVRYAMDYMNTEDLYVEQKGTEHNVKGSLFQTSGERWDKDIDAILNFNKDLTEQVSLGVNLGAVRNDRDSYVYEVTGNSFIAPGIYHINNMNVKNPGKYTINERRTNALFANVLLDYKGLVFLDGSIRNDWYSVLTNPLAPGKSKNEALYGGIAASFVLSDMVQLPSLITFSKLRASYGTSGTGNIDPYSTLVTYSINDIQYGGKFGSQSVGHIGTNTFPSQNLRPTINRTYELGLDLKFLSNRLGVDVTVYKSNSIDQLIKVSIPRPTAYAEYLLNAGNVLNKGIEIQAYGTPIKTPDFTWNVSLNIAANRNEVLSLAQGVDNLSGESARFGANLISKVGGQSFDIYGKAFERSPDGQIVYDAQGLPVISDQNQYMGNFTPDFFGGLTNTLNYKNISLSFLFDFKYGGEVFSLTNALAYTTGKHPKTLEGRENPFFEILGKGVAKVENSDGTVSYKENTTYANLSQYYGRYGIVAGENMFDATYVKLRQMTIGYTIPRSILEKTPFNSVDVSLTGRNLFFLKNGLSKIGLDPEATYSLNGLGFEYSNIPSTRSYGANINVKF